MFVKKTTNHMTAAAVLAAALVFAYLPKASADDWDHKTIITFGEAVQIPGQALPAGTYTFKTMRSPSDDHVVQIFDQDGKHLYATLLAIPVYRDTSRNHGDAPAIKFEERLSNEPQAVKVWFRPGDDIGQEFIYSKNQSKLLAMNSAWAIQGTATTEVATAEAAPVLNEPAAVTQTPAVVDTTPTPSDSEPTPDAEAPVAPAPSAEEMPEGSTPDASQDQTPATTPSSNDTNSTPSSLPKTGSELPLIGMLGTFSLLVGTGVSKLRKRVR
jgi:LPXTG-motif cell wall-anchored protein